MGDSDRSTSSNLLAKQWNHRTGRPQHIGKEKQKKSKMAMEKEENKREREREGKASLSIIVTRISRRRLLGDRETV